MEKIRILAWNNIKKNLAQYITFGIILTISALMLHLGVITKLTFEDSFSEKWEEQNAADVFLTVSNNTYDKTWIEDIKAMDSVSKVEVRDGILLNGSVPYGGNDMDIVQNMFRLEDCIGNDGAMNQIAMIEKSDVNYDNPIYLSYWMKLSGGYKLGDTYIYTMKDKKYEFTVAGFVEDMQYGSNLLSVVGAFLPKEGYEALDKKVEDAQNTSTILVAAKDIAQRKEISQKISELTNGKLTSFSASGYYDKCKERTVTADIGGAIFIIFAALVVLVSLLVSNFKISNSIDEEMQNMGALKALGYTGKQIIAFIIAPYMCIGLISVVLGIGVSYLLLPVLKMAFNAQTGFIWSPGFSLMAAVITVVSILILIFIASYLSAKKIRKLKPIEALRGGIETHNFRKNYFAMAKTKGNVNIILALKSFAGNMRQNILLLIVLVAVTISALFAGTMFYNTVIETEKFCYAITEENPSLSLKFADKDLSAIKKNIAGMENANQVLYYNQDVATFKGENLPLLITQDYSLMANDICYEGRNPEHSNEIALGSESAKKAGVGIEDSITITFGEVSEEYIITGLVQAVNYSGVVAELTEEGFLKLNPNFKPSTMYVYLKDDSKTAEFINNAKAKYPNIIESVDYVKSTESGISIFVKIIGTMCGVIILFTALLIIMILYLLIKTVITHKKQEMGILKAMGYTTRQLVLQTACSFVPTAIIATVLGAIIGRIYMNSILVGMLSSLGIMKMNFNMPTLMVVGSVIAIIVFTFLMSVFLSGKIKKISAYSLIKE